MAGSSQDTPDPRAGRAPAAPVPSTPLEHIPRLVDALRQSFSSGKTRPLEWRQQQLRGLQRLLHERNVELLEAMAADLGKPEIEGWLTDVAGTRSQVGYILRQLPRWATSTPVRVPLTLWPARARTSPEPLGVALVIAPWNYPIQLLVVPLAYAIAAGNAVAAKPSEMAPHTSAALARWLPEYVDGTAVRIVEGGAQEATALLEQRWDTIFYTGGERVGRLVLQAAAAHLTPVTLELGGKSPALVDRGTNITVAGRRIVWGKFLNAGQSCIAPDYVVAHDDVVSDLVDSMVGATAKLYEGAPRSSPDFGRIVNDAHLRRLQGLLRERPASEIIVGGQTDESDRYLAPTIVRCTSWDDPLLDEEIFGPILPVFSVRDMTEAVERIRSRPKPLALYLFSENPDVKRSVLGKTSSGSVGINATMLQFAVPALPFGGVGASGMGAYHGKAGFDAFSHRRSILERGTRLDLTFAYPPYSRLKASLLRWFA